MAGVDVLHRQEPGTEVGAAMPVRVVDCDVHPTFTIDELPDYIAEPWRSQYYSRNLDAEIVPLVLVPPAQLSRTDATTPEGEGPGVNPDFVSAQLLQHEQIDFAMLFSLGPRAKANPRHEQAICAANNAWLADTWLSRDNRHGRYRAAIRVCPQDPEGAARQIETWAEHPYFVQVGIAPETPAPLGQPQYHPLYEAAERNNIPVTIHVTRVPGMRLLTPVGFPAYHLEHYSQYSIYYMCHLVSLVFEGVFEKFPKLRVALIEGGFTWLPGLMNRMDQQWEALRSELPMVKRRPSEYIYDHVRLSTQPVEEPEEPGHLAALMQNMDAEKLLMFATDYPHYDFDSPRWVGPRLPREARDRIMSLNAIELFDLPSTRPRDYLDDDDGSR
jgi:predicted TIM-barrel fold metal-dependent hydrolase